MHNKPSPLAALKALDETQEERLWLFLKAAPYHMGVEFVQAEFNLETSVSGLRRWWKNQSRKHTRRDFRNAIKASEQFDKDLDSRSLDTRAANAIRAAFWQAVTEGNTESIKTMGTLVLDYNSDARGGQELQLKRETLEMKERKLELDRAKFDAAQRRLSAASETAKRLNASGGLTKEGLEEIERAIGMI
ncbi:MAG: hypothetical protein PHI93_10960 [Kiritimatiellae bacterium]|nr:hypothetical protein [Kiritimatiellia bacterium]